MTVIVLDDEKFLRETMISEIEVALPDVDIVSFALPRDCVAWAKKNMFDVAFLDIQMLPEHRDEPPWSYRMKRILGYKHGTRVQITGMETAFEGDRMKVLLRVTLVIIRKNTHCIMILWNAIIQKKKQVYLLVKKQR